MKRSRQVWESPGPGLVDNRCDFSQNFKLHSSAPSYAHGVNRTRLQTYDCHSGLPTFAGACLEFYLDPTQEMYLFHDSLIYLDLQIVKIGDDGKTAPLKTDDSDQDSAIGMVPMIAQTIFKRISLECNNNQILDDQFTESFDLQAYWRVLIGMTDEEQQIHLKSAAGFFTKPLSPDEGIDARKALVGKEDGFTVFSKILHPFFQNKRAFPGHFRTKISLYTHPPRYLLINTKVPAKGEIPTREMKYDIRIKSAKLLLMKVSLEVSDLLRQQRRFQTSGYSYLFPDFKYGEMMLEPNSFYSCKTILSFEKLPKNILFFFRKASSIMNFRTDPYRTLPAVNIKQIYLEIDDDQRLPLGLGYSTSNLEFNYYLMKTQLPGLDRGIGRITELGWKQHYTCYPFSLLSYAGSYGCNPEFRKKDQIGTLKLTVEFVDPLTDHIIMSFFMERDQLLTLNSKGEAAAKYY